MTTEIAASLPLLTTMTLLPLLTAIAVLRMPPGWSWPTAFIGGGLNAVLAVCLLIVFDSTRPGIQVVEHFDWLLLHYRVGVDGTNIMFIPLATLLGLLTLVYTLITRHRGDRVFIACLLAYQGIMIGAFSAMNALQFWLWCLLELLPISVLTLTAGTGQHRDRVMKLVFQYWLPGLAMSLCGFVLLSLNLPHSGGVNFDWLNLTQHGQPLVNESVIFVLLFFGFAVRMPLFPFHAWLPPLAEHGTTGAAIFLHGLKLGIYALVRYVMPLAPHATEQWTHFAVTLGLIGIFYGALLALMQINLRRLLSYAVISHTGMLVVGVFLFNDIALEGSILLALSYGLAIAGMLFAVGLIYERTRTTFLPRLGGLFDSNTTIALLFLISALSTMEMPGTPGFDAVHLLIEGTIEEHGWLTALAILFGNVLATAFLLWAFQRIFIMQPKRAIRPYGISHHPLWQERIIALVICGLLIITGFYTAPVMRFVAQEANAIDQDYPQFHSHHRSDANHD